MIALKRLAIFAAIFAAVVAGGLLLGRIAFEINIARAPQSAPTAQQAHQPVSEVDRTGASGEVAPPVATEVPPIATVQEAQPTSAPATGPAKKGPEAPHKHQQK